LEGTFFNYLALSFRADETKWVSRLTNSSTLKFTVEESAAERLLATLWRVLEAHDLATPLLSVRSAEGSIEITLTFPSPGDRALVLANFANALAAVGDEVESSEVGTLVDAVNQQETRNRIKRWRQRAEELRTAADQFLDETALDSLRRAAGNCEKMADYAEALLDGKPTPPVEEAR
jgi:signal transduction histidine kinase